MATFAYKSFNSNKYAAFRPTYPSALFQKVLAFHRGGRALALDVGCGNGQATKPLAPNFQRVVGTDPSEGMVMAALEDGDTQANVEYTVNSAEDLGFLGDRSVDLVVSGQAAHWFDHAAWFREMARILRPGGTLSFWGYAPHTYSGHPKATEILLEYISGADKFGPYWPEGRHHVASRYEHIHVPRGDFTDELRVGDTSIHLTMPLGVDEKYVRTWSPVHHLALEHRTTPRAEGGGGDMVDELFDRLKASETWTDESEVTVDFSIFLVLARKI